jgi:hypothetical protein
MRLALKFNWPLSQIDQNVPTTPKPLMRRPVEKIVDRHRKSCPVERERCRLFPTPAEPTISSSIFRKLAILRPRL